MRPCFFLLFAVCIHLSSEEFLVAKDFEVELKQLSAMRKGRKTDLAKVDQFGAKLLQTYPEPKEQGQIYYNLAHIHAQSGVAKPDRLIEYAQRALEFPLDPSRRARLFVYSGDAIQVRGQQGQLPFTGTRKSAALQYLKGLKEVIGYNLPEQPPDLPSVSRFSIEPASGPVYEAMKHKHDQQQAALMQARFQGEMIIHRDVLQKQIVSIYTRRPIAIDELQNIGTHIIGKGKDLDRLMAMVNDKVSKLPPELVITNPSAPPSRSGPAKLGLRFFLYALPLLAIVGILILIRLRERRKRAFADREPPTPPP